MAGERVVAMDVDEATIDDLVRCRDLIVLPPSPPRDTVLLLTISTAESTRLPVSTSSISSTPLSSLQLASGVDMYALLVSTELQLDPPVLRFVCDHLRFSRSLPQLNASSSSSELCDPSS